MVVRFYNICQFSVKIQNLQLCKRNMGFRKKLPSSCLARDYVVQKQKCLQITSSSLTDKKYCSYTINLEFLNLICPLNFRFDRKSNCSCNSLFFFFRVSSSPILCFLQISKSLTATNAHMFNYYYFIKPCYMYKYNYIANKQKT